MKYPISILFICFLTFINCSTNNDDTQPKVIEVYWSLTNTTGGLAGVDDDFNKGEIKWVFNELTETLIVDNQNTDNTKQDGLASGNYSYSILEVGLDSFLLIDSEEVGRLLVSTSKLTLDENVTSQGDLNDGFVYTFTRTTVSE
jgi:hypothetical protein